MKKTITLYLSITLLATAISSCIKKTPPPNYTVGTWNVDRYEGTITSGGMALTFNYVNIGTYTFYPDNKGNYALTINGNTRNNNFTWSGTANTVTVTENDTSSTVYNVITNEKNRQVWTSNFTDNGNTSRITATFSRK